MGKGSGCVSLIIPVYNAKDKLRECLESVVSQTYPEMEIIIVDDCSTDGSLEICREFEKRFSDVHVYTKKNEGVSAARNYGLSKATGMFVQFADSDDRLYPEATAHLVNRMQQDQSDVVIGGYWNEKENREVIYPERFFSDRTSFRKEFPELFSGFFIHVPWNKLYRRDVIQNIRFPDDLNKGEDLVFNLQVFAVSEKISILSEVLYFYHNVSDHSLSFCFREDAMEIEERLYEEVKAFLAKDGKGEDPVYLDHFYLTSLKNKCYDLVRKSGYDARQCRWELKKWCRMESIQKLSRKRAHFGMKDRLLLLFLRYHMAEVLRCYFTWAAKR